MFGASFVVNDSNACDIFSADENRSIVIGGHVWLAAESVSLRV